MAGDLPNKPYLTIDEVADFLDVEKKTIQNRVCEGVGHPPVIKKGRTLLFPRDQLIAWLNKDLKKAVS